MISIARAGIKDANDLLKVKMDAFKADVGLYGMGPSGYDSMDAQLYAIKNALSYKIMDGARIIGGMCIFDRGEGFYWLGSIYIATEYQNKGIGSMAMRFLETEFPDARKWGLDTPYLSFRNHHFYEKMGFTRVGETAPDPEHNGFHLFIYAKVY